MKDTIIGSPQKIIKRVRQKKARGVKLQPFLFLLAFLLTTGILLAERNQGMGTREFIVGEPAPRTLFSPIELTYVDQKATDALREKASQAVPGVFVIDHGVLAQIRQKADAFFKALEDLRAFDLKKHSAGESGKNLEPPPVLPLPLSEASERFLLENPRSKEAQRHLDILLDQNLREGLMDYGKKLELLEAGTNAVTVSDEEKKDEKDVPVRAVKTVNEVHEPAERLMEATVPKDRDLRNAVMELFTSLLVPNLHGDDSQTQTRRKKAAEAVNPIQEKIKKNELIVQRGMLITAEEKARIDQIEKKMAEHKVLNKLLALGLLVFLAYLLCFLYLVFFEKRIFSSLRMVFLILSSLVVSVSFCKLVLIFSGVSPSLMPAALAALLLVLLADARLGVLGAVMMSVLTAPLAGYAPEILLGTLLSGLAGAFASLQVRKRIQFIKVGAAVGLSYFAVLFAFRILQESPWVDAFEISALGIANGFLITAPLCFFLLIPLFESVFNLATDITLLELSDLNHPLLKRMIVEAPGTYHHSLVVSTLAESACEAIGANALLARVGCYFHDIGKIARSEFFTENQANKHDNKHDRLTATMSCLVIMNHVKEGMELGRRHKLKERILRFIPEHHGTGVIYYFYKKAMDSVKSGEKEINADDFRYPGPKPQSRETAVALLADSTEAASRSLKDPSSDTIRQLVRKIINDKFIDGQLDECDLTLKDLYRIQESFIYNLMAIFHTRVSYPPPPPDAPDRPDLFQENQFTKFRFQPPQK